MYLQYILLPDALTLSQLPASGPESAHCGTRCEAVPGYVAGTGSWAKATEFRRIGRGGECNQQSVDIQALRLQLILMPRLQYEQQWILLSAFTHEVQQHVIGL